MSEDFINLEKKPDGKKDITLSILVLIIIFILVFGFVLFREYAVKDILSTTGEKIVEEVEDAFSFGEKEEAESESENEKKEEEKKEEGEIETEKEHYLQKAETGDGLTHLARRALTSYMEDNGLDLSDEERVYVEDYVQKRIAPEKTGLRYLDAGEEVEIPTYLLEEGVSEAQNLTPTQIENLSQYASMVSF